MRPHSHAEHFERIDSAAIRPGSVTLVARDLAKVARFYEEAIGLRRIADDRDVVRFGAGGPPLLVLHGRPDAEPQPPRFAGLFHTALLLPSRADLGAWLAHALKSGIELDGASDHQVSEALYLSDPEGNGIEVYADRPRKTWKWIGGQVVMTTDRLDVHDLVAASETAQNAWSRMPDGTCVGHVHLRVGGIPEAERFYGDKLGLDITSRHTGATFYSTGRYHHHLATNIWHSQNAPKRSVTSAGLASVELLVQDQNAFDDAVGRMEAAGAKRRGDVVEAADPWGILIVLSRG